MNTLSQKILTTALVFFSSIAFAQKEFEYTPALTTNEVNKVWFKPFLVENKNPALCNELLDKGAQAFFSSKRDLDINFNDFINSSEVVWENYGQARDKNTINVNNKLIHIGANCYGAGSDNESCSIWISNNEETKDDSYHLPEPQKIGTSENIVLVKNKEGRYLLITASLPAVYSINISASWKEYNDDDTFIDAYEITDKTEWQKVCGVSLKPTKNLLLKTHDIDNFFSSLTKMYSAAAQVTGGSGGTTHGHYTSMFMDKILYRPWALSGSFIDPGDIHPAIVEWGYLGANEFEKLRNYKLQLEETSKVIAKFYEENFGWSKEKSLNMAHSAILGALNVDNKFSGYVKLFSDNQIALRKAILERRPLNEIKVISIDANTVSADIAVMYPDALNYILEKGVDPNTQNDFGKTALMYAAQYNQLESVKILLARGANPNLFTTMNGYGLKRAGMTALHYAVRYASADVIKTLLNAGAFPFSRTSEEENYYPIDWLHIYTNETVKEPNLNISKAQLPELESLLKLLNVEENSKKTLEYILQGEKEYQQNKNKTAAYDNFKFALALDPKNERALNDFSLIGITMEKWGEALESSQYIIDNTSNNLTKADAYYNYGLACEKSIDKYGSTWTQYNGKTYCTFGLLDSFIKSYQLKPMAVKAEKIISIFNDKKIKVCNSPTNESPIFQLSFVCEEKSALCVLSGKDKLIDIRTTFNVAHCPSCGADVKVIERESYFKIHPQFVKTYELGDYHLAIYNGSHLQDGRFFIDGKVCDGNIGIRNPDHSNLDNEILAQSKDEREFLPREKIATNSLALPTLFYLTQIYNRLHIKNVHGDLYAQFPDNTYVKIIAGDNVVNAAKLYIPKGASFSYNEGNLEPDFQNERVLKVMDLDEFIKNEGKNTKVRKYGLVDLSKLE